MNDPDPPPFNPLNDQSIEVEARADLESYLTNQPYSIPVARPLSVIVGEVPPVAVGEFVTPHGRWRALLEMLLLIPAGLIGAAIGYVAARLAGVRDTQWENIASTLGMGCAATTAAAAFVWADRRRALRIAPRRINLFKEIGIGVLALFATYIFFISVTMVVALIHPSLLDQEPEAQRAVKEMMPQMPMHIAAVLMLFVAIWEEVIFRGFLLTRLRTLLGRWWLAIPASAIIFGSVHAYEGHLAMVAIGMLGLIMALIFVWRKSLVPCIAMHFLHDMIIVAILQLGLIDDMTKK